MTVSKSKRVNWPTYFMNIAKEVSTRSTCDRKHVGAVIVRDKVTKEEFGSIFNSIKQNIFLTLKKELLRLVNM